MTDNNKKTHLVITGRGGGGSGEQVQADWNQSDNTQPDYIKNKPELATVATSGSYNDLADKPTILTQWFGTQAEYDAITVKDPNVIYNIEGSDNVQADWNQSDTTADDYIKNKPTIPAAPVQSDWNEADSSSLAYINNKPAIPAAQVNSDWNANSGVAQILNKPTIPTVPAMATETLTFTLQGGTTKTIEFYTVPNYFYVEDVSGSDNTLMIKKASATAPDVEVFYSTDKANWTSMGTTSTTNITATIPVNGKLYLKANANSWSYFGQTNRIITTKNSNVGGNIMSLLYGDNFENQTTFPNNSSYNFANLFQNYSKLVNASNLELPVTTMTDYCYSYMFGGCTALTTAPVLPATTLAQYCCQYMFNGCTSLTTAPALPATTLAWGCYRYMFSGCSNLTTTPATLPATTLVNYCYEQMFSTCSSLTTAPELPATTLVDYCYDFMFNKCSHLNKVTTYANNISARNCIEYWLNGVAATGDFYNMGGATYTSGTSGIPNGWTVHTSL